MRVEYRFGTHYEDVSVRDPNGYITTIRVDGAIFRTHTVDSVDCVRIGCTNTSASVVFDEDNFVTFDLITEKLRIKCNESDTQFNVPVDDFFHDEITFNRFAPSQPEHVILDHYYHGDRDDKGLPHGMGIALWPNGRAYVGEWCQGSPSHKCGFGVAPNGGILWESNHDVIQVSPCGYLMRHDRAATERVYAHGELRLPSFRAIPKLSAFGTHFRRWRTNAKTSASERMMRALILSESTPTVSKRKGSKKKNRNRNKRYNVDDPERESTIRATTEEETTEHEAAPSVDVETTLTVADEDDSSLCVVCITNARSHVIIPCGHMCLCQDCMPAICGSCPMCRGPATSIMRVYM